MNTTTKEYVDLWKTSVESKGYRVLGIYPENGKLIATIMHPRLGVVRQIPVRRLIVNL